MVPVLKGYTFLKPQSSIAYLFNNIYRHCWCSPPFFFIFQFYYLFSLHFHFYSYFIEANVFLLFLFCGTVWRIRLESWTRLRPTVTQNTEWIFSISDNSNLMTFIAVFYFQGTMNEAWFEVEVRWIRIGKQDYFFSGTAE